jgi:glyoxylase-like metal-dependent hydrolase (beta-lactamase superfamily II)
MRCLSITTAAMALCGLALAADAAATDIADLSLTRLDCGKTSLMTKQDLADLSDINAFGNLKVKITYSCYLIKHGADYMIWDTGHPAAAMPEASSDSPKTSLVQQLTRLKLTPGQIKFVGISHYHGDHTGQVALFPDSTLLIGKADWDLLADSKSNAEHHPDRFAHWISGGGKVDPVSGDRDIFGDGSVIMLNTPGHTPGHHSLIVNLKERGPIMLSGDLAHFRENYDIDGVPTFNTNRADTLASLDRFKKLATNLHATVIIQHDARDVEKLPPFPSAAK